MNYIKALASLIPIILLGDLVFQQISQRIHGSTPLYLRLSLDWALGTGTVTLIVFHLSLINAHSGYLTSIVLVSLLGLYQLIRILKALSDSPRKIGIDAQKGVIAILMFLVLLTGLWFVAAATGLGLDGTAHWGIKAKASFLEGGWTLIPTGLNRFPHQSYPLLVPTQQAWLYTFVNADDPKAVKIIFVLFYLVLGGFFYHAIRRNYSKIVSIVYSVLMMTTPLLTISFLPAYADVPLMVFVFGNVIFIHQWLETGDEYMLRIGAILAAFALLAKLEGTVYWLFSFAFVIGYASWSYWRTKSTKILRQALFVPLIALIIAGSWYLYVWQADIGVQNFVSPTLSLIVERSDRLPVILDHLARLLILGLGYWGLLWLIFLVVSVWKWRNLARVDALFLWLSVTIPISALSFSFIFSRWPTYITHIETALPRIIMHTVPMVWLFIASQTMEIKDWFQSVRSGT